ncbi:NAD-dependent epimerase/dehydratase family protein [Nitrospirillum iridis]|uniref:Nucleoside-diphosphate-sugar epimerase n=1 Tax=Nitrospirillum iridis TaxID=765888 RepID=A0A7X0EDL9_9PROT|nr:NAD(P)-dependent oxidoreductase [Nitrospirillum iridis]MBB6252927.1 nucleoside-diphosphate-sugar epimerase [Nitrospirillum iridis]
MRIAITGASGFLGLPTARLLVDQGHTVAAVVRSSARPLSGLEGRLSIIEGTLEAVSDLEGPLTDFQPDVVVHCGWAGVGGADRDRPAQLHNIAAAGELAAMAGRAGAHCFIGIGSQAEYGPADRRVDEEQAPRPTTLYGVAKLASALATERICRQAGLRWAWLRVFSLFGPRDNPGYLIPTLIERIRQGQSPALTGCEQRWDYLFVDDAAAAIASVAESAVADGIFNLGAGDAPPLIETISRIRDLIDPAARLGVGEIPYRPDQVMHLEADISRLTAATGWRPRTPLGDGLRATVAWHLQQAARHG